MLESYHTVAVQIVPGVQIIHIARGALPFWGNYSKFLLFPIYSSMRTLYSCVCTLYCTVVFVCNPIIDFHPTHLFGSTLNLLT